jgi:hypothetical protein
MWGRNTGRAKLAAPVIGAPIATKPRIHDEPPKALYQRPIMPLRTIWAKGLIVHARPIHRNVR